MLAKYGKAMINAKKISDISLSRLGVAFVHYGV